MASKRTNGTGSVYRDRSRGTWVGEALIDGKRRRVVRPTKVLASAAILALLRDDAEGIAVANGNATVSTVLDLWAARVLANRPLAPSSAENYEWALRVLRSDLGGVRLRSLDVARIEKALDRIATGTAGGARGRPVSQRTLKLMRSTLAQALDALARVRDDDDLVRSARDDLLPEQRTAQSLDQVDVRVDLVRAIDRQIEAGVLVEGG